MPGELVVRFRGGTSASERYAVRREHGTSVERALPVPGAQLLELQRGRSVRSAAAALEREDEVLYAEPNFVYRAARIPNDPGFGQQWGLHNSGQRVNGAPPGVADADIDAPEAWDMTIGSSSVTVAVVDTGVLYDHPDLAANAWTNAGERGEGRESNAIDDDGNGLVDDVRGWDYIGNDNDPADISGHGTHVAGTIGAYGDNGAGVAGVSQRVSLMPLRAFDGEADGTSADIASAFAYASAKGSDVVNASFGGPPFSLLISNAIAGAPNTLFVAAAGNDSSNNDHNPYYPCNDPAENVICVAASDQNDGLASFSNVGAGSVDLAAPGTAVLSTFVGGYSFLSGTSMAAPHVSGVAALVRALRPGATATAVRSDLLRSAEPRPAFAGRTATGGRLNARGALLGVVEPRPPAPGAEPTGSEAPPATGVVTPAPALEPAPALQLESARDTTAPSLSVTVARGLTLSTLRARGLKLSLRCDESCEASSTVLLDARTARALGLRAGGRPAVIGRAAEALRPDTTTALVVKLSARARARLGRAQRPRLLLRTAARDAAGNLTAASRRLTLSR